jgi:hypothetical protein
MESWRKVWREALALQLSSQALQALRDGLIHDDPRLLQGATTSPPPLECVANWPVEAACGLGYCGWKGEKLETVADVEEYFAKVCFEADHRLGQSASVRWFLNWFDETPHEEMRRDLLAEVNRTLAQRLAGDGESCVWDGTTAA